MELHLIFFFIATVLFFLLLPIYKKNVELYLTILIVINFDFFKLIPPIAGFSDYREMLISMILLTILYELLIKRNRIVFDKYGYFVVAFLAIAILGVFQAASSGQPIDLGFRAAKYYSLVLIYFVVVFKTIDLGKLTKYIIVLGVIVTIVLNIQYYFYKEIKFFHTETDDYASMRYGRLRFALGWQLVAIASVLAFSKILKKKVSYILPFIYLSGFLIFAIQTRMLIAAYVVTLVLLIVMSLRTSLKSIIILIIFVSLAAPFIYLTYDMYSESKMHKETVTEVTKKKGSYIARLKSYEAYYNVASKSPMLGFGVCNPAWLSGPMAVLEREGMHLSDIGMFSTYFYFGIIGVIWFASLLISLMCDLLKNRIITLSIAPFFLLAISSMLTLDLFIRKDIILILCIFIGLLASINRLSQQKAKGSLR